MHAISSYRGNRPTNTRRSPAVNPQAGPITIHRAAASLARSVIIIIIIIIINAQIKVTLSQ